MRLERAETGSLRCDSVGLSKRHGAWRRRCRALSQHQPRTAQNRGVVLLRLLSHFARLAFFVVLLQHLDRARLLAQEIDHEGHGEVVKTMAPRKLENNVGPDEVVAGIQHANVAFAAANIDKLEAESEYILERD